jgi:hypothetical protein
MTTETQTPPEPSEPVPVAEAIATALAATAHQHAAAVTPVDEPAPHVQQRLPLPRAPFDFEAAFKRIDGQRVVVHELARIFEGLQKKLKSAKQEYEDAEGELKELLDSLHEEHQISLDTPEADQLSFTHGGAECAWEKEHPGQVCGICAAERERLRQAQDEEIAATIDVDADLDDPGVVVRRKRADGGEEYFAIGEDGDHFWTTDGGQATVFDADHDARAELQALNIALDDVEVISAEVTADAIAADTALDGIEEPTEPAEEP